MSEVTQPSPRRRSRLSTRKKLMMTAVTLLGALLLLELGLRVLGFPKGFLKSTKRIWATASEQSVGPFRPEFEATISWPRELTYTVETNRLGMRGPEPHPDRPVVLCLGDSTTFGSHVAENETYPFLLQAELDRRGLSAAVVNAGCPRTTISDQNLLLERALPELQPKAVVLLFCGNDLTELDKEPARDRALRGRSWYSDLAGHFAISDAVVLLTLEGRRAYLESAGRWPQPLRPDQGRTEGHDDQWHRYGEGLIEAQERITASGAKLILSAFPGYEEVAVADPCEIEQRLPGLALAAAVPYVDLYGPFRASDGDDFLLPHDAHANASGNARIARVIADALEASWED